MKRAGTRNIFFFLLGLPVPLLDEFNRNKETETSTNERITNRRSMKYRNTDNGIISTFVKLPFLSMSVMRQI